MQITKVSNAIRACAEQQDIVRRALVLLAIIDQLLPMVDSAAARVDRSSQAVLAKAFRGELIIDDAASIG
jgi:hypothetical protein